MSQSNKAKVFLEIIEYLTSSVEITLKSVDTLRVKVADHLDDNDSYVDLLMQQAMNTGDFDDELRVLDYDERVDQWCRKMMDEGDNDTRDYAQLVYMAHEASKTMIEELKSEEGFSQEKLQALMGAHKLRKRTEELLNAPGMMKAAHEYPETLF